ncbi:hypothetical protein NDU88_003832 [Pleurodeles waltl]|uniref:Uncharacterized protein n=1 Tax=Pleurodeles waltl TaxID=8319 RepID=A0AAV7NS25_PLEWA|nr:hypothetical protein NDU88_003832 [Pleurodeles waltl]
MRRSTGGKMVCVSVAPLHTRTCVVIFHSGKTCVVFRHADHLLLWVAGITRCPGSVRGFSCLFSGCASVRGAVRRNFTLMAGGASISPWKSGGVVLARPCVKVSVVPKASRRSASVCGVFLAAEQAVRRKVRRTKRPSETEKSFWS